MIRHLVISDLHICRERDGQKWSSVDLDLLLEFLLWADGSAHTIPVKVICDGDTFEGLYDPDLPGLFAMPVVAQMRKMIRAGKLYLVRGNHDERVARHASFRGLYATQGLDLILDGVRYRHGHVFDWRCLPGEPWDNVGARLVWLLSKLIRGKPDLGPFREIVGNQKVTNAFDAKARSWAAKNKAFLVCGHTHSPRIDAGPGWCYCNAGSWQNGCCDVLAITVMPLDGQPTPAHPLLTDAKALMGRS